jgi:HSP20 family protein
MADILETEEFLLVVVELPGVALSDLSISTHGGDVILKGEKRRPTVDDSPARFHVAERAFGRFRRVIHLGVPVNTHRAEAILADGHLRIKFPKVPNRRGEEVAIEVKGA